MFQDALSINNEIYKYRIYDNAGNRKKENIIPKLINFLTCIKFYILIYVKREVVLPYCEIVVTTKCSLKCKDCASLIPYYNSAYNISLEDAKKTIDRLFDTVDRVRMFGIIGGETFLYPKLDEVIEYILNTKKVDSIRIFTNATMSKVNKKILRAIYNKKVHISISNYNLKNTYKLYNFFKAHQIKVVMDRPMTWRDRGGVEPRNRTSEELKDQFHNCYMKTCKSILNGRLYFCPRSGHGHDLGLIDTPEDDYVDLHKNEPIVDKQNQLLNLYYGKHYVRACDYCDVGTDLCVEIPAALQLTAEEEALFHSKAKK